MGGNHNSAFPARKFEDFELAFWWMLPVIVSKLAYCQGLRTHTVFCTGLRSFVDAEIHGALDMGSRGVDDDARLRTVRSLSVLAADGQCVYAYAHGLLDRSFATDDSDVAGFAAIFQDYLVCLDAFHQLSISDSLVTDIADLLADVRSILVDRMTLPRAKYRKTDEAQNTPDSSP